MAPAGSCFEVTVKLQSRVTYKPAFTCYIHGPAGRCFLVGVKLQTAVAQRKAHRLLNTLCVCVCVCVCACMCSVCPCVFACVCALQSHTHTHTHNKNILAKFCEDTNIKTNSIKARPGDCCSFLKETHQFSKNNQK